MLTRTRPYETSLDHLWDELALLDVRLTTAVGRARRGNGSSPADDVRGLFLSEDQVDAALAGAGGVADPGGASDPLWTAIEERRRTVDARRLESLTSGVQLRLDTLREIFDLGDFEIDAVVACLAPELDLKYETLYAYVQDDIGRKRPTLSLLQALAFDSPADRVARRRFFASSAPLLRHEIVRMLDDPYAREASFLARPLALDQRIVDFLLGSDVVDARIRAFASLIEPEISWDGVVLAPEIVSELATVVKALKDPGSSGPPPILQLVGGAGTGKRTVTEALCQDLGRNLLAIDVEGLLASDVDVSRLVSLSEREALLRDAVPCWHNFHLLLGDGSRQREARLAIAGVLGGSSHAAIVTGLTQWAREEGIEGRSLLTVDLPLPAYAERARLWEASLNGRLDSLPHGEASDLAGKFRFAGGQIRLSVSTAQDLALLRPDDRRPWAEDLHMAARWHSNQALALLAQKIEPRYTWDDIVLPADQKLQLREVSGYLQHRELVYGEWGFHRKGTLGKGMAVLFAGPSGTGKTMSAEIMAGELGLDLYKIDLSTVVSKYIGETEKNLDRIFREAEDSNATLFFDEADAIFGKRVEVRDSHDRYANIEVSYLLQKMEEHQGVVILATNFRKNVDDAFVRRLHSGIELPFPDEESRLEIWRRVFPLEAPLEPGVDLPFLARQFRMPGGHIKNVAVTSAFLAAQEGRPIGMDHVMRGTKREYQKMGKLVVESDFGPYFDLVHGV